MGQQERNSKSFEQEIRGFHTLNSCSRLKTDLALAQDSRLFLLNTQNSKLATQMWSWGESNSRPDKAPRDFLHA